MILPSFLGCEGKLRLCKMSLPWAVVISQDIIAATYLQAADELVVRGDHFEAKILSHLLRIHVAQGKCKNVDGS